MGTWPKKKGAQPLQEEAVEEISYEEGERLAHGGKDEDGVKEVGEEPFPFEDDEVHIDVGAMVQKLMGLAEEEKQIVARITTGYGKFSKADGTFTDEGDQENPYLFMAFSTLGSLVLAQAPVANLVPFPCHRSF